MSKVPNSLEPRLATLRFIADAGFAGIFDIKARGAQLLFNEFPRAWAQEYERGNYHIGDPVLLWAMTHLGVSRWETIVLQDPRGILEKARRYGLNYGVIASTEVEGRKSVISAAKSLAPFTDREMSHIAETLEEIAPNIAFQNGLTRGEVETLAALRHGFSYEEAAEDFKISLSAVKQRVNKAKRKLGAVSTVQAVAMAMELGCI
ncbi:MAG: autoinducer binding domain-containing protein [Pseudomonadota bacterium]